MLNIVLLEPLIPQNTGNIMRTAVATNARLHLVKPLGFLLDDSKMKRAGLDYIEKLDLNVYENFDDFAKKNQGTYYFFTRYGHKAQDEYDYTQDENIYLIFGKETTGIDKHLLKDHMDHLVRIPMHKNVRALNLSNSVAVGVYEVLRQLNYAGLEHDEYQKGKEFLENYEC